MSLKTALGLTGWGLEQRAPIARHSTRATFKRICLADRSYIQLFNWGMWEGLCYMNAFATPSLRLDRAPPTYLISTLIDYLRGGKRTNSYVVNTVLFFIYHISKQYGSKPTCWSCYSCWQSLSFFRPFVPQQERVVLQVLKMSIRSSHCMAIILTKYVDYMFRAYTTDNGWTHEQTTSSCRV